MACCSAGGDEFRLTRAATAGGALAQLGARSAGISLSVRRVGLSLDLSLVVVIAPVVGLATLVFAAAVGDTAHGALVFEV
jgi:hypothetical protein